MRTTRQRGRRTLAIEILEPRACPSITIQIDYSLDSLGFFASSIRRDLLQVAADTIGSRFTDSLSSIVPSGSNSWSAQFANPATGNLASLTNLTIPADTILVFAGGQPSSGSELGTGGPGGYNASGDQAWIERVEARGQAGALATPATDFGPWGGAVAFDTSADWYFGMDPSGLAAGQNDFLSIALHEMSHLLGIGTASAWDAQVVGGRFLGTQSTLAFDGEGSPPVNGAGAHWADGTTDGGFEVALDPTILEGSRKLLTGLDFAAFDDIGWTLVADPDATIASAIVREDLAFTNLTSPGGFSGISQAISFATDVDIYRFTTDQAMSVAFASSSATHLRIFDIAGTEVAQSLATPGEVSLYLPFAGTFFLGVSSRSNASYSPIDPLAGGLAGATGIYAVNYAINGQFIGSPQDHIADLVVGSSIPASGVAGETLVQTISVVNLGPQEATGIRLGAYLPPQATFVSLLTSIGTAEKAGEVPFAAIASLAPGTTATVQIRFVAQTAGTLSLTAFAMATTGDPVTTNNQVVVSTTILPRNDGPGEVGDVAPPTIASVRVGKAGRGARRTSTILVSFSEPIDESSANFLGPYVLTRPGPRRNRRPGRPVVIRIRSATFGEDGVVTLLTPLRGKLPKGLQLVVRGQVRDLSGNTLDGDRNGVAGGDATVLLS